MSLATYAGNIGDFLGDVNNKTFIKKMCDGALIHRIGFTESERISWEANAVVLKKLLAFSNVPNDVYIAFEYKCPIGGRIDCMLFGEGEDGLKHIVHIELKQWSNQGVNQIYDTGVFEVSTFVGGARHIVPHPSQQAYNYQQNMINYIAMVNDPSAKLDGFVFCYNYNSEGMKKDLFAEQYRTIIGKCPVYCGNQIELFAKKLSSLLLKGHGMAIFEKFSSSPIKPTPNLVDAVANIFKNQDDFVLMDDQITSSNVIFGMVEEAVKKPNAKLALIVKGGPGTGKTLIALHVISKLAAQYGELTSYFTTRSKALRETLKSKLSKVNTPSGACASGIIRYIYDFKPSHFSEGEIDVLLIDEAHRIQNSSNFMTDKKDEQTYLSQVMSLLYCSKVCIFFIDDDQGIKSEEIGLSTYIKEAAQNYASRIADETNDFVLELNKNKNKLKDVKLDIEHLLNRKQYMLDTAFETALEKLNKKEKRLEELVWKEYQLKDINSFVQNVDVLEIELKSQFRCNGSDNYLDWLDTVLYNGKSDVKSSNVSLPDDYMFDICDSPEELERRIRSLNAPVDRPKQIARIVAGYCWDWSNKLQSNGDLYHDVKIGDWEMPWETNTVRARCPYDRMYAPSSDLWSSHPMGINQVGCIFSAQGFEVDYVGVIMGPDIGFDVKSEQIITIKGHTHSVSDSATDFDTYIRNIYRVLLSRGKQGCLVYCCDRHLAEYLKSIK